MALTHHPTCNADYPEKVAGERPRQITRQIFEGFYIDTCVDCGATDDNMPPEEDPFVILTPDQCVIAFFGILALAYILAPILK